MDYQRWTQIDRHNHELLARMDKIMLSRGRVDHINDYKAKPWLVGMCAFGGGGALVDSLVGVWGGGGGGGGHCRLISVCVRAAIQVLTL